MSARPGGIAVAEAPRPRVIEQRLEGREAGGDEGLHPALHRDCADGGVDGVAGYAEIADRMDIHGDGCSATNKVRGRIASPRSAPEQLCRCLTWMFPVVATVTLSLPGRPLLTKLCRTPSHEPFPFAIF